MTQTYEGLCNSIDVCSENEDLMDLTQEPKMNKSTRTLEKMFGTPLDAEFLRAFDE